MATTGPVVETVSRKRVVPPAELEKEKIGRTTPDFWEFIETMTPEMWGNDFTLYILREDPKPSLYGGTNTLEKCPGYIAMPDGTKQPLSSREDIELAIKQKYGGKAFRLILKRANGERITEGKCINEAPPRYPDAMPQYPPQHPLPNSGGASQSSDNVAVKAMETVANQNPQLINIAIDAVSRAADIVARHNAPAIATTSSLDSELDRAFKQAMINKLLATPPPPPPPPDPLESLKQFAALRDLFTPPANSVVDKLVTTALDRFMNPVAPTGKTTLLDLGRELIPVLGTAARETMHEYRLSVEAQARIAELSRGIPPQPHPAPPPQINPPAVAAPAAPAPGPQIVPPPAAATKPQTPFPQIEAHIAKIITNSEYSVDEMVDNVLSYLYDDDPRLVGALLNPPTIDPRLKPGKEGLMQLFTYEPPLQPCLNNLPRLSEFLDKFLIAAKEAESRAPAPTPA